MNFLDALQSGRTLLADGATGTMLQGLGLSVGEAPERWLLDRPDAIRDVARQYVQAGADMIYTCTFGAARLHLKRCGWEAQLEEMNRAAVKLAREATANAGRSVFVVGSVGPTGEMLEPYGDLSLDAARESFAEQAALLAGFGVDALVCETFTDLSEALVAVTAAQETKLPVLASMAFDQSGRTMMGVSPEDAVVQLSDAGAVVVGTNCSVGPEVVENAITAMKVVRPTAKLLAKPNAGLPQMKDGKTLYPVTPEEFGAFAKKMKSQGVAVIGGCCGSTPQHIKSMRIALDA